MKQLKLSWIGLFSIAFFTLLSCQKDLSGSPEITSAAKGSSTPNAAFTIAYTINQSASPLLVGGSFTIDASAVHKNGTDLNDNANNSITVYVTGPDGITVEKSSSTTSITETFSNLAEGCYSIRIAYQHTPYNAAAKPVNISVNAGQICVGTGGGEEVQCNANAPLTITQKGAVVTPLEDDYYQVVFKYEVTSCMDIVNVKTQGGLTAGSTQGVRNVSATSSTGSLVNIVNENRNNTVLNWIENISAGQVITYTITYERRMKAGCNNTYTLSGDWSSKVANYYVDGSTLVAGYNNSISKYIVCQ